MQKNNKRIAKNTLMLYFRMMLIMGVTLYTSRVVLEVLGVEDFGIYNVVGGIVVMFGFLNSAMSSATQRFLSFEMGRKDYAQLKKVFSLSVTIHALIAVVIFILAETIGLWFLNTQLTIPADRMEAANWVYQFSIFAFMVNVMAVPYNAAIISHERMNVYAYVSIIEVLLKLAIVFLLQYFGFDKLKLYAILVFVVSFIIRMIYQIYCKRKFEECTWRFIWDKEKFREMLLFSNWNIIGSGSSVLMIQGVDIALNIFFGVGINAARGIANQATSAVTVFISNFMVALNPHIIKTYAMGDYIGLQNILERGSRYSFFLLFILSFPILLETEAIMHLWLGDYPSYSVVFIRLSLIFSLINSLSTPLTTAILATGKVKKFQLTVGAFRLSSVLAIFCSLYLGIEPITVYYILIISEFATFLLRAFYLSNNTEFSVKKFSFDLLRRIIPVLFVSLPIALILSKYLNDSFFHLVIAILSTLLITFLSVFILGITKNERNLIYNLVKRNPYFSTFFNK